MIKFFEILLLSVYNGALLWFLRSQYPPKPRYSRIRPVLTTIFVILFCISDALFPVPWNFICLMLYTFYRFVNFFWMSSGRYSRFFILSVLLFRIRASVLYMLSALMGIPVLEELSPEILWMEFLSVAITLGMVIVIKQVLLDQTSFRLMAVLLFLTGFIGITFIQSALALDSGALAAHQNLPGHYQLYFFGIGGIFFITIAAMVMLYRAWKESAARKQMHQRHEELTHLENLYSGEETALRKIRHDQMNLTQSIYYLIEKGELEEAKEFIREVQSQGKA